MTNSYTYRFEDFANGPICLNCGEPADHNVELGEQVEMVRSSKRTAMVAVRLTHAEFHRIAVHAARNHQTVSEFIRAALRKP